MAKDDSTELDAAQKADAAREAQIALGSADNAETNLSKKRFMLIFVALLLARMVSSLSANIASTALPTIVGDLGGVEYMQWITTAYILASTVTMPVYGKMGDILGRKYLMIAAIVMYTAGKLLCMVAPDMGVLLAGRVVSGLGGGGIIILAQAIVADISSPRDRGKYLGILHATFGIATFAGPLIGGWIVEVTTWRAIFLVTIPFAVVGVAGCALFLPKPRRNPDPKFDIPGTLLMAAATSCLVIFSTTVEKGDRGNPTLVVALAVAAVFLGIAFVLVERRAAEPIIPMYFFKNKNFVLVTVAGIMCWMALMGTDDYFPTWLQIARGMEPAVAGLMMASLMAGNMFTSTAAGFVASATGRYKWMILAMFPIAAAGFFLASTVTPATPVWQILVYLFIIGFGLGMGTQMFVLVVQNEFSDKVVGTATAAHGYFRQIGKTLGASVIGATFTARLAENLSGKLPESLHLSVAKLTPGIVSGLDASLRSVIGAGYTEALMPIFTWYLPCMAIGFILCCFIRETPLAKTVVHTGDAADDVKR
jgi:EmrB/QacA subfamily drug resistance transporter